MRQDSHARTTLERIEPLRAHPADARSGMTPFDDDFIPRSLAQSIVGAMGDTPVVCLLGPRRCGKSTLAMRLDPERLFVSLDESRYPDTALNDLDGSVRSLPRRVTIGEVQHAPRTLRTIKRSVNLDREPGRFLLTGSANLLLLSDVDESSAGRMEVERLQPVTESEKRRRPGAFLQTLLQGGFAPAIRGESGADQEPTLARRIVTGGYPEAARRRPAHSRSWHREYVRSIVDARRARHRQGSRRPMTLHDCSSCSHCAPASSGTSVCWQTS